MSKLSPAARVAVLLGAGGLLIGGALWAWGDGLRGSLSHVGREYEAEGDVAQTFPTFDGPDATREKIRVHLEPVVTGLTQPTDVAFPPGSPGLMVIAQKTGALIVVDQKTGARRTALELPVLTDSEQGLLGVVFHPRFAENGRLYVHTSLARGAEEVGRIAEWTVGGGRDLRVDAVGGERVLLEVVQPYANHNGGQLAFGPDGYLYIGLGDGGWRHDPHGHGQNTGTLLGAMLRIDVDTPAEGQPYGIPADNPLVGQPGVRPEIFAWGLRNPWRFSFAPDGRLLAADVGQDRLEEIDVVGRGANLGWKIREGRSCFQAETCDTAGLVDPIYQYNRKEGSSVTGGYVYTGARIPALRGLYVFGDFVAGRMWALPLPPPDVDPGTVSLEPRALGRWLMLISTFGRDEAGELYVADFGKGTVLRLDPG